VLISAYDAPYMRRTNHTGAATRLGTYMPYEPYRRSHQIRYIHEC
jgi:hypothetical protein